MSQRNIYLGMPGYGHQTQAAGRAFWRACADDTRLRRDPRFERDITIHEYAEGSLLASNFNSLWVNALNRVKDGERIDYFAMLHDDIGAEDFWLDKLIDELEAKELDVLGVVAPIKDSHGFTSIALEHPTEDRWRPLCRLTMHEVFKLPGTFTSEHLGHRLLINTGCWVCRFDMEWADRICFTIKDRIVIDKNTGRYEKQTESEDWGFARVCHKLGLKVGCTRKVRLLHRGSCDFPNTHPWGYDSHDASVTASVLPTQKDTIQFPFDVDGWLLPEEGEALAELARGKRVLEIGSYHGKSTICMAQVAREVVSIDPHEGEPCYTNAESLERLQENLQTYKVADRVKVHVGTVEDYEHDGELFDLVFIDGNHDTEAVKNDIAYSLKWLKPDGLLAFHDYRKIAGQFNGSWDEGVNDAVDELIADGGEIISIHASLAVVKAPAAIPLEV